MSTHVWQGASPTLAERKEARAARGIAFGAPDDADRAGLEAGTVTLLRGNGSPGEARAPAEVADVNGAVAHFREFTATTPSVSVVIPARNEAECLPTVLGRIPAWIHEVILVDGRSHDATIEVALAGWSNLRVLHQTGNGKGEALRMGFAAATGDIVVMLDADGSTDPAEIPRFVAGLRTGADFAKGTRFVTGGGSDDLTLERSIGNRVLTRLVNTLWSARLTDLCYGYVAFWRHHLDDLDPRCRGFEVETLLTIRALEARLRIVEIPSFEARRISGSSQLRPIRDGSRVLRTILAERIRPR